MTNNELIKMGENFINHLKSLDPNELERQLDEHIKFTTETWAGIFDEEFTSIFLSDDELCSLNLIPSIAYEELEEAA